MMPPRLLARRHAAVLAGLTLSAAAAATGRAATGRAAVPATTASETVVFTISAGPLDRALMTYAAQTRRQVLFDHGLAAGLTASAVTGALTPDVALARLLNGTGITAVQSRPGLVVLKRAPSPAATLPLAAPPTAQAAPAAEEVVVTGSLIRGAGESASPLVRLSRDSLDRAGQATVADALQALPQAFGGTSTPQTALIGSDGLGTNFSASTGVNLRGLGADSTLVLVNGRRLAGSGLQGDFADVSAIPTAAVDRVEVLLDGASALYGSDAVGGVVNIILRSDFQGAETRLRVGGATQGGDGQYQAGQTFGHTWTGGHIVVSYEYDQRDRLVASDRPQTADADLRPLGGTDHRLVFSHPGNILGLNADGTAFVPIFAIPEGQSGVGLTPASFLPGTGNLENYRAQGDILPRQDQHSVYVSAAQDLNSRTHLEADLRYTHRTVDYNQPGALDIFQVTAANPFFVSPDGAPSQLIGYSFGDELGPVRNHGHTENAGVSAGATFDLARTWKLDVYTDWAQTTDELLSTRLIDGGFLDEALGNVPDTPATSYSPTRDGYFNPYGAGGANGRAVLDFIGSGYNRTASRSRVESVNVKADGVLFDLPGGEVKLAIGGQVRREDFKVENDFLLTDATPQTTGGQTFTRTIGAGFAELRVHLVGPANAITGVRRLELSLAGRVEHYGDVGTTGNPKLGLIWTPVRDVQLRASYGTSFRAPALPEVFALQTDGPTFLPRGADNVLALVQYGGSTHLRPQTATTYTGGGDWRPRRIPGLTLSASWFDIAYEDRIGQPVLQNLGQALSDPSFSSFIQLVSPATNAADLAEVQALLAKSGSATASLFPATSYGAVVDARFVNTSSLHVRGLDTSAFYSFTHRLERFDLGLSTSYLASYDQRLTPTSVSEDLAGVTGYPAALRLRGSANWTHGAYGATLTVTRISGSHPAPNVAGADVDSWSTVDGQLLWRPQVQAGPLRGLTLALNVSNLLDAGPPFYDSPNAVGYDPANTDVVGRTASLQLVKAW